METTKTPKTPKTPKTTIPPKRASFASPAVLLAAAVALAGAVAPRASLADGRLPGEAETLTTEVRATAQKHLGVIAKGGDECPKAVRALLVLGPVVWPVVENAMRLTPSDEARPHLTYLKALLLKKADPDFELLREAVRRKALTGNLALISSLCFDFRLGRPDPARPGKRLPLAVQPTKTPLGASISRCPDGTMVVGFGADGEAKVEDAGDLELIEPTAGFVAGIGGKPIPAQGASGRGANVVVKAPMGFAYAWATDGAAGMKPDGTGGEGGSAEAKGGAGEWSRAGNGGKGAGG